MTTFTIIARTIYVQYSSIPEWFGQIGLLLIESRRLVEELLL